MIHTEPNGPAIAQERHSIFTLRNVAFVQGAYFLLTGLWPILSIDTFQAVTGPKTDLWLVYTVGAMAAFIGSALLLAAANRRLTAEVAFLGIGSAAALAAIDVIFVVRGVLSWVYLVDAVAEAGLIIWWAVLLSRPPRPAPPPQYPHVAALLGSSEVGFPEWKLGSAIRPWRRDSDPVGECTGSESCAHVRVNYRSGSKEVGGASAYSSSATSR